MKKLLPSLLAIFLIGFGLLTLFLSTSIIFDWFGIRAKEDNYVLFVVWANFICSLFYLFSAYGFIKAKKWTFLLLGLAAIVLIITFCFEFEHPIRWTFLSILDSDESLEPVESGESFFFFLLLGILPLGNYELYINYQ